MLRITVDLIPHGLEEHKKTLTYFEIANDGSGTPDRGNYKARMQHKKEWIEKIVVDYPRKSYPVLKLVYLTLRKIYGS